MTNHEEPLEPLIPADIDLTGYPFTPLFRARLFGSEFHATATDSEWRAGVTLWLKSWDQQPAGTLPAKDVLLARLAEVSTAQWMAIRDMALHGWQLCTDGRLHHAVVAEGILEAWAARKKNVDKGVKGAAKRWGTKAKTRNSPSNGPAIARLWPKHSYGDEGNGDKEPLLRNGEKGSSTSPKAGNTPVPTIGGETPGQPVNPPSTDHSTWVFNEALSWLAKTAKKNPNSVRSLIGKWRRDLHDDDLKLRQVFEAAMAHSPIDPVGWLTQAIATRAKQNGHAAPLPDPEALGEDDLQLARMFGGIATDTLLFRRTGKWPTFLHGPAPDQPGTKVPPVVLSRHGYAAAGEYAAWKAGLTG